MNRKASAKAPRSRGSTAATASAGERPLFISSVTRWATTSVSVSEPNFAPLLLQLLAQLAEILDDAVVDDREAVGGVRMRVAFGRPAVGRPAGMADADGAGERLAREPRFEIAQLALGAPAGELSVLQRGDAGRVVAAVFEPLERVDERARDRLTSENAHNSAHASDGLLCLTARIIAPTDDVSAVNAEREINIPLNL